MAISKIKSNSIADDAITSDKIADGVITADDITDGTLTNAKLANNSITIDGTEIVLGASASIVPYPTISSIDVDIIVPSAQTEIVITGTNFKAGAIVDAINSSTGAITTADTVARNSATQLTVNFTLTAGTYYIRIENTDGLAVRSGTAILTASIAPSWSTAAGSLGSIEQGSAFSTTLLAYDDDSTAVSSYSLVSGSLPTGLSLAGDSTIGTISGTEAGSDTVDTTYNFTIRATDNESQTTDRAFSITVTIPVIEEGGQFN